MGRSRETLQGGVMCELTHSKSVRCSWDKRTQKNVKMSEIFSSSFNMYFIFNQCTIILRIAVCTLVTFSITLTKCLAKAT